MSRMTPGRPRADAGSPPDTPPATVGTATPRLDEGDLVWVAAAATRARPEDVLDACDLAGLASVAAAVEGAAGGLDAAATTVVELGRRRPFARGNAATAWLAAAHLLGGDGLRLRIGPATAVAVFDASAELDARVVAAILREHTESHRPLALRVARRLFAPRPLDGPAVYPCPACGRPLVRRRHSLAAVGPWIDAARLERVARCAVEHGAHGRHGEPRRTAVAG